LAKAAEDFYFLLSTKSDGKENVRAGRVSGSEDPLTRPGGSLMKKELFLSVITALLSRPLWKARPHVGEGEWPTT